MTVWLSTFGRRIVGKHSSPADRLVDYLNDSTGPDTEPFTVLHVEGVVADSEPTQVQHPWKATIRTAIAVLIGVLSVIPVVVATAGIGTVPAVAQVVAVTATITRVMALPQVNDLLGRFGLGAA